MTEYRFIEPLDVLHLRGNRLFGEGGAGDAVMPPMPSVVAGALRARMLVSAGADPHRYGRGELSLSEPLATALGTPDAPGQFTLTALHPARRRADGELDVFFALPADLTVFEDAGSREIHALAPTPLAAAVATGSGLPALPALRRDAPGKPVGGHWLTVEGWARYVTGGTPRPEDLVHESELWKIERRLGIALQGARRAAADGHLYTSDVVSPRRDGDTVGLLVGVDGVEANQLPCDGLLRLGGDGRGAGILSVPAPAMPRADRERIAEHGRFRVVLTTPGLFPDGWRLPGLDPDGHWSFPGGSARLQAAAVPRAVTVSGWNLAAGPRTGSPKVARRAAPAGSVYWFEDFRGDPEALGKLAATGLWGLEQDNDLASRRAEGFNRFAVANA